MKTAVVTTVPKNENDRRATSVCIGSSYRFGALHPRLRFLFKKSQLRRDFLLMSMERIRWIEHRSVAWKPPLYH
jgi:hypothetical protein